MNIEVNSNKVTIKGNIKSVSDYQQIKSKIESIKDSYSSIDIHIVDSMSIISSVIGYLNKLVLKDKIKLHIYVGNNELIKLFKELNLTDVFDVRKA